MAFTGSPQEVPDRPLLTRERLALAVILIAALTVATCSACGHFGMRTRNATDQHNAAVRISTICVIDDVPFPNGGGSGVIVSSKKILTALHVVDCAAGVPKLIVDAGDGPKEARVEVTLPQNDIARIELVDEEKPFDSTYFTPVQIGPKPEFGERICEVAAIPRWTYRCGEVQATGPNPDHFYFGAFTEFGNSGSAVYSDGKIVGLISTAVFCQDGHTCVGGITPLAGLDWLIP